MHDEDRPIRVGLIGYGYVGKTFHAPLVQSVSGLELTVVGSSRPDAVLADLPQVQVVADPLVSATHHDVDLVVIAGPNESHYPLTPQRCVPASTSFAISPSRLRWLRPSLWR